MTNYNKVRKETQQIPEKPFENEPLVEETTTEVPEEVTLEMRTEPKLEVTEPNSSFGVTTTYLNMRSDKSVESIILEVLPVNLKVEILDSTDSEWYKVAYKNKTGYVLKNFIKEN